MKNLFLRLLLILIIVFTLNSCHYRTYTLKTHKDFDQLKSKIKTIAVAPPFVKFIDNINSLESPVYTDSLQDIIKVSLEELLQRNDFNVRNPGKIKIDMVNDKEYALLLAETARNFLDKSYIIKDSKKSFLDVKMYPKIRELAKRLDTDYLILILGEAVGPTGVKAPQNIAPVTYLGNEIDKSYFSLLLEIALVDAKTTEIILYDRNIPNDSRYLPLNKSSCQKLLFVLLGGKLLKYH